MALVAVIGALCTVVFHPLVGLPIASYGLVALTYNRRSAVAAIAAVVGGALAAALASSTLYVVVFPLVGVPLTLRAPYVFGTLVVASLAAVGPVTAWIMRRRPGLETVVFLTGVLSGLQLAALALLGAGAGMSVTEYVAAAIRGLVAEVGIAEELAASAASLWPSALVAMNGMTALLVVAVAGTVGARSGAGVRGIPALAVLDLDPRVAVVPIAAVALLAAGRLQFGAADAVGNVGMNLLVIARWVFFLQGIAVFAGLYERARFARPVRAFGFVLLGLTEAFVPAVSLTGLADIWLNVRRLPREGSAAR